MEKPSTNFLFTGPVLEAEMINYFSDERKLTLRQRLNRREMKIKNDAFTYRTLNHWERNGLLEFERGDRGTGWRRISIMDAVWLDLISELRNFGVSLEHIRQIKDQLVSMSDEDLVPSIYPPLEFFTYHFLRTKIPVNIMVFDDFSVLIGDELQIQASERLNSIGNHIRISLPRLLQNILRMKDLSPQYEGKLKLSDKELSLILEIRTGTYRSIKVRMKDGQIVLLEKEKNEDVALKRLSEIMKEKKYEKVIMESENGEIVNITRIIKQKL